MWFNSQTFTVQAVSGSGGEIDGTVFADANGNGAKEAGETGLAGVTVFLDQNSNGLLDGLEASVVTAAAGTFAFTGLAAGTYRVAEQLPSGQVLTTAAGRIISVAVTPPGIVTGVLFGDKAAVASPNQAPHLGTSAPTTVTAGTLYRYAAAATDPNADPLAFDLPVHPAGMAVDAASGLVAWRPTPDQVGAQSVLLRVQDGQGGVDLQSFTVTVSAADNAPVISSTAPTAAAVVALPWRYAVHAQDADSDSLTYSLSGMSVDATGLISWTPAAVTSAQTVTVTASDGHGGAASQSFTVSAGATGTEHAPVINAQPRTSAEVGKLYVYALLASDADADPLTYSMDSGPTGMTVDSQGVVRWTPTASQFGSFSAQVRVTDGARGGVAIKPFSVAVGDQVNDQAPAVTSNPPTAAVAGRAYAYNLTRLRLRPTRRVWVSFHRKGSGRSFGVCGCSPSCWTARRR